MGSLKINYFYNQNKSLDSIIDSILEVEPLTDEIEALLEGRNNRVKNETISHDKNNWN